MLDGDTSAATVTSEAPEAPAGDVSPSPVAVAEAPPVATVAPADAQRRAEKAAARKRQRDAKKLKEATAAATVRTRAAKVGLRAAAAPAPEEVGGDAVERIGPTAAEVAGMADTASALWTVLGVVLPKLDARLQLSGDEISVLSKATAPVLAKYLPAVAATPEAQLGVAVAAVFAPKILAVIMGSGDTAPTLSVVGAA